MEVPNFPADEHPQITITNHTTKSSESLFQTSNLLSKSQINGPKSTRKIRKRSPVSFSGGIHIWSKRKNARNSARRSATDVEAIAFPLGMSIAAVLAQVVEKDFKTENAAIDHLSMICTSAVRESLTNVFGDKFDAFARNFEKSFGSTLGTLRLIKNSSTEEKEDEVESNNISISDATQFVSTDKGNCSARNCDLKDYYTGSLNCTSGTQQHTKFVEGVEDILSSSTDSRNLEHSLEQQISSQVVVSNMQNCLGNYSGLSSIEKSVIEQTRANDLKSVEIGLIMKKLQLKETQLQLNSDLNFLERCKLSLGVSRTSFKTEKFKNQLEETRHSELLKTCADFLVAGLLIMSGCLGYGVYAFSYDNLHHLTNSCSATEVSKSWWILRPMATFNSGLQTLSCQVQVYSRMLFGLLMILAIAYVLMQRSEISRQAMPITFLILLLGVGCGFAGKLCVDTLGGDGYQWLIHWEVLCMLHFFINVFTPSVFYILNGSVQVSQVNRCRTKFPFWLRRWLFYLMLISIPVCCGLLPFANPRTWWDEHFSKLITNYYLDAYDETYDDRSAVHH